MRTIAAIAILLAAASAKAQNAPIVSGGDAPYWCFERTLKEHPEMKKEAAAKACGIKVTKALRQLWKEEEKYSQRIYRIYQF